MKYKISDLLDDMPMEALQLTEETPLDHDRIRKLTMGRVNGKKKRLSARWLIAAALIAALAVPVVAGSTRYYENWLEGLDEFRGSDRYILNPAPRDGNTVLRDKNWVIRFEVLESSVAGVIINCYDWRTPGRGEPEGELTVAGESRLEMWDGSDYVPLDGIISGNGPQALTPGSSLIWEVDWEDSHGPLEPGGYRLLKVFTYTDSGGKTEELLFRFDFRIFEPGFAKAIETCSDAVDTIFDAESYHMVLREFSGYSSGYSEYWKSGEDYLTITRYFAEDGSVELCQGMMLRDGVGYRITWEGDYTNSEVSQWEVDDAVDEDHFVLWANHIWIANQIMGEVFDRQDGIDIISYDKRYDAESMTQEEIEELSERNPRWNYDYTLRSYAFFEDGELKSFDYTYLNSSDLETADRIPESSLAVLKTPEEEIARMIASVDIEKPRDFSWEDDLRMFGEKAVYEGFCNEGPNAIASVMDIIKIARTEVELPRKEPGVSSDQYDRIKVYFDDEARIWKVKFGENFIDFYAVYIREDGSVHMVFTQPDEK